MGASKSDILLIGGGHSHVGVLADWARRGCPARRATLLTPEPTLRYSGMVPGWLAGEHTRDAGLVDLAGLARAAGVDLVLDRCVAIDPESRTILSLGNGVVPFDLASIDVGGVPHAARVLGDDPRLLDIRPIDRFVAELERKEQLARSIAVIGGGAGGVEIAFALRQRAGGPKPVSVTLIAGERGLLPDFSSQVRRKVVAELARQGIAFFAVDAWMERGVLLAGEVETPADLVVAAIGSAAPDWPRAGGLAVDEEGFIAVDRHQRSTSHPYIFAAGDCARRIDAKVAHSGVHAVHTGRVLAANLRAASKGKPPRRSYRPRPASLYLLSTGTGEAILSYGPFAVQSRWAARLKAWIDKRWIATYAAMTERA
ncbi:MAG: FAD-dependent oxidoreductase [Erythrobacter sp.]|uniref:FAD-dependent oxidoreductase n=1 Tax=Erythrobacter sp. TaxID=1042 RepID=UPI0026159274|nr:FAD-dependent oxidoreductase [Erythrobacter sp.]MDJ0979630.1 FAD-dependent oxidoreductase [Erythrobacter sp.]